ncbi:hypothetical protein REPUB_Repub12eG0046300 [Reevesia pubescens]
MEDFGAKEHAEAEASNHKAEKIRGCQPKPKQKRQKQSTDESGVCDPSSNEPGKRGRKRKLTTDERRENKLQRDRLYRKNKAAKTNALQEENQELEEKCKRLEEENKKLKEKEVQPSEMNSLKEEFLETRDQSCLSKEELSEINARADRLAKEVSGESKKVNMVKLVNKALEPGMQQLQQNILNQDDQLNNLDNLKDLTGNPDLHGSKTIGSLFGEGTSIAKAKLSPLRETINVKGFRVLKDNSPMIQEIISMYPNIASGLRVHHPASVNGLMNTLAEVYKMAIMEQEKHTLEKIKLMEEGIKDLEFAGFEISWLKDEVVKVGEEVEEGEEIRSMNAKIKLLEERKIKRREERESKRQRAIEEFFSN